MSVKIRRVGGYFVETHGDEWALEVCPFCDEDTVVSDPPHEDDICEHCGRLLIEAFPVDMRR